MLEENEKSTFCISSSSTEADLLHFLTDEVMKNGRDNCRKLEDLNFITSSLSTRYNKIIENNENVETSNDLCEKFFNAPKKIQHEQENSMKYHMEEMKMKKEIRDLERKLNSNLLKNQIISQEVLAQRKKKTMTEEALCLAKRYYSSVWDMNIHIEESKEDRFTCIINFKFDCGMYPIKFVIDRNNQEIISWDGSSFLTNDEESEMKVRYSQIDHCFPKVLSELRLLALNKIKLS